MYFTNRLLLILKVNDYRNNVLIVWFEATCVSVVLNDFLADGAYVVTLLPVEPIHDDSNSGGFQHAKLESSFCAWYMRCDHVVSRMLIS